MWSRPSRCRIVAWRSWTCSRSSTACRPSSSVAPMVWPPLHAAAGHPHGEAVGVVVAAVALLAHRRAAELAAPDDQRLVEQAAALQVVQQAGDRLVASRGRARRGSSRCRRGRPTCCRRRGRAARTGRRARPAGGPAGSCRPKSAVSLLVQAVEVAASPAVSLGEVDRLGRLGLHAEGQLVAARCGRRARSARAAPRRAGG